MQCFIVVYILWETVTCVTSNGCNYGSIAIVFWHLAVFIVVDAVLRAYLPTGGI